MQGVVVAIGVGCIVATVGVDCGVVATVGVDCGIVVAPGVSCVPTTTLTVGVISGTTVFPKVGTVGFTCPDDVC